MNFLVWAELPKKWMENMFLVGFAIGFAHGLWRALKRVLEE